MQYKLDFTHLIDIYRIIFLKLDYYIALLYISNEH